MKSLSLFRQTSNPNLQLEREWTLWFDSPHLHKTYKEVIDLFAWKQNLEEVSTFSTIGNFWGTYNNTLGPDEIWYKSAYYLFTSNTAPHCLDLNNQDGVTIHFSISSENMSSESINSAWLYTILSFLGGSIKYAKYVNGISIKKHKNYYELVLWLSVNDDVISNFYIETFNELYKKKELEILGSYKLTLDDKFC